MKSGANKRAIHAVVALLVVGGLGMLAGAAWTYADEHSGRAADARVTDCTSRGHGKYKSVHCTGTWSAGERTVTGPIFNGRMTDEGRTLAVRVHGNRATRPTLWISIGLLVMGGFVTAVGGWLLVLSRRAPAQPT